MPLVSEQVKMVLDRMDTHPDEFIEPHKIWGNSKWADILNNGCFNQIEKFLLKRKYRKLKRSATQQAILQTIIYGNRSEDEDYIPHSTIARATKAVRKTRTDAFLDAIKNRQDADYPRF